MGSAGVARPNDTCGFRLMAADSGARGGLRGLLVLGAIAVMLCGCASGSEAVPTHRAGSREIASQLVAYAATVSVHTGDVAGLTAAEPQTGRVVKALPFSGAAKCYPSPTDGSVIGVVSPGFIRLGARRGESGRGQVPLEEVGSAVYAFENRMEAVDELSVLSSAPGVKCLGGLYRRWTVKGFGTLKIGEAPLVRDVRMRRLTARALGPSIDGWRMTAQPTTAGLPRYQRTLFQDYIGFTSGRVLVLFHDWGYGERAFPCRVERRLVLLLRRRAVGARLSVMGREGVE